VVGEGQIMGWRHRVARKVHSSEKFGDEITYGIVECYDEYGQTENFIRPQGEDLDWLIWELAHMLAAAVDAKNDEGLILDGGEW